MNHQKEAKVESVYCRKLNEDSNMKIPEMEKIFKENYNVEVSRSTVWRALIKSNYSYTGLKIRQKYTDKEK